jgi:hypothetical protein
LHSPAVERLEEYPLEPHGHAHVELLGLALHRHRAVAVQFELEKQLLKPGFHFTGSRVETGRFQAMAGSTAFNLYRPTVPAKLPLMFTFSKKESMGICLISVIVLFVADVQVDPLESTF